MSLRREQHIVMLKKLAAALQGKPSGGYTRLGCCIATELRCDAGAENVISYDLDAADLAFLITAVENMPRSKSEMRRRAAVDGGPRDR